MTRRTAAVFTVLSIAAPVMARVAVLGVILQAKGAHIGTSEASSGATVFDGDQLDTDEEGSVMVSAGKVRLNVLSSSTVNLAQGQSGLSAALKRGTVVFAAEKESDLEVVARSSAFA